MPDTQPPRRPQPKCGGCVDIKQYPRYWSKLHKEWRHAKCSSRNFECLADNAKTPPPEDA